MFEVILLVHLSDLCCGCFSIFSENILTDFYFVLGGWCLFMSVFLFELRDDYVGTKSN